jgi:colanic acid biosynthesis glycosyl transferase WcaI
MRKRNAKTRPLVVLCPHFAPDTAPTGVVMTRIVEELVRLGHEVHVVTSLPWYRQHRVEDDWQTKRGRKWGRAPWHTETTAWGSITRVTPFAGNDKSNIPRRALGFLGFSILLGVRGLFAGGVTRRAEAVVAMSPPLTLGLTGWMVSLVRRCPLVFNIQDVFPDAAIATGKLANPRLVRLASWLERVSYKRSDAVVVLSDDLQRNVASKLPHKFRHRVAVIPNFVDAEAIVPRDTDTAYRAEHAAGAQHVVMYAGNVGFSQSIGLLLRAAGEMPEVAFVVNGEGSARSELEAEARALPNVTFVDYQPAERLSEVLASADVHVVPLKAGLGAVSVPSKAYSIMASGRPILASIDADSEVARIVERAGCGRVVSPDDTTAFVGALRELLADPAGRREMGDRGREWVVHNASPAAVGEAYHGLIGALNAQIGTQQIASQSRG